ncbi:UMTA methyltransferase family protein [Poronia punctata]|nr:UMTA methyltransferase family protein [Poronia punctata]
MSSDQKDSYVFTRDILDNARLNLMHYLWTRSSGFVIHPKIPVDKPDLHVADVGAGTGAFLCDISETLPKSAKLYGLDISLDALPPQGFLPSNVTLRTWDVRTPVPEDLVGLFDIVHIRFFIFVLLRDEVPGVMEKLVKLLKPGGYLQWVDSDNTSMRFEKMTPENSTENLVKLMQLLQSQSTRLKPDWVPDLPKFFSDSGLVDVDGVAQKTPPHHAFMMHESGLMMHDLIARKTQNSEMAAGLRQILPLAVEETRKGAYITTDRHTIIGRKP